MVSLASRSAAYRALRGGIVLQAEGGVLCRTEITDDNLLVGPNDADSFEGC
jgi:hypothetical protein